MFLARVTLVTVVLCGLVLLFCVGGLFLVVLERLGGVVEANLLALQMGVVGVVRRQKIISSLLPRMELARLHGGVHPLQRRIPHMRHVRLIPELLRFPRDNVIFGRHQGGAA